MGKETIKTIKGNLVDIINRETYGASITLKDGKIFHIQKTGSVENQYILPGFIDAHVHIESSMCTPANFGAAACKHGTIGIVADPHEIANVLGVEGIDFMVNNAEGLPFYYWIGVPSCVPATPFESSGAIIDAATTKTLLQRDDLHFLAEMMNYPGVLGNDAEVINKIKAAQETGKPIDGHFPNGKGEVLSDYIQKGISTDHECSTLEEGEERCRQGMFVQIREGSAAKNFTALHPLIKEFPDKVMLCSDDIHPNTLLERHINGLVKRALDLGYDLYDVLRASSYNQAKHYGMPIGFLQEGDSADFIIIDDLKALNIKETFVKGECIYDGKEIHFPEKDVVPINKFHAQPIKMKELEVKAISDKMRVIVCTDGNLDTSEEIVSPAAKEGMAVSDTSTDIIKIVVVNRYQKAPLSIGFIKGTGLKRGAVAQSITHDSHNIIAIGCTDEELAKAINEVILQQGGITVVNGTETTTLSLPIAGLLSPLPLDEIDATYKILESKMQDLGSTLSSLQMTLAFMSLLVIPSLKLGDKGLFNGDKFSFTTLFV
ncbi:MAG: adenine deaminase [Parabacteroides sp.]|nr:adenine deaminase [Parabacteroides sp.]